MKINLFGFLFLASVFIIACKKDTPTTTPGTATFKVLLTDDPADYDAVYVDVQSVEIHSSTTGWSTLTTYAGIYNLLDLTNGIDTLIVDTTIPEGTISQVRLNLGTNNSIVVNGVTHPLEIPSGNTSGLKINIHQDVVAGGSYALVLDFDAGHSIVEQGNGEYKLKPVIHGQFISGAAYWGSLSGVIIPPASLAFISATSADDSSSTYINALTGQFMISYLNPGTYTVNVNSIIPYNDTTFTYNVVAGTNVLDTIWVD